MTQESTTTGTFTKDLARLTEIRQQFGERAADLARTLIATEEPEDGRSGALGFGDQISQLTAASENLREGRFRLLVMGDMKRGKSTILNVLLGENLLPSAVTKCTAILTILRFGPEKKVAVVFTPESGKAAEDLSFDEFRSKYTIRPEIAKDLEESGQHAFPHVSHAVVEYPLALLQNGVEIVDSPGLNDTLERNELTLGFVRRCHAALFVLDALGGMTMVEKQYINDHLEGRGQSVFFLINKWDLIRQAIVDPENPVAVQDAESKVRSQFRRDLEKYFANGASGAYDSRVFELSSRDALRRVLRDTHAGLEGTGFPPFLASLTQFLENDRLTAEVRAVRLMSSAAYRAVHEAIALRIPLLSVPLQELEANIRAVDFTDLVNIRDSLRNEINSTGNEQASRTADCLKRFLMTLDQTFESDFEAYTPQIKFFDLFRKSKREEFQRAVQEGFQRYLSGKMGQWTREAETDIAASFLRLAERARSYGLEYSKKTEEITQSLTGVRPDTAGPGKAAVEEPWWARLAAAGGALILGDPVGAAMATNKVFRTRDLLVNVGVVYGLGGLVAALTGVVFSPLALILPALGMGAWQATRAQRKLAEGMKEQLREQLPQIAADVWPNAHQKVRELFDDYRDRVTERIDVDIAARRASLDDLVTQRRARELDRDKEAHRLQDLDAEVLRQCHVIETEETGLRQAVAA